MPNRYEREIEEILRNLETPEPKAGLGQKFAGRLRRKPGYRTQPRRPDFPSLNFRASEWFIIIAIVAALISGGYAYANGQPTIVTGILAIVGAVCLILLVLSPFLARPRNSRPSSGYGNIRPLHRNPLNSIATRWNLLRLKLRYRRKRPR